MSRYWVGGTGNWSDNTHHWSASSGGSPGASLPSSTDDVILDSLSGLSGGTIHIDSINGQCRNFTSNTGFSLTLDGSVHDLEVYGSLTLESGFATSGNCFFDFYTNTIGNTITLNSATLDGSFYFRNLNDIAGSWILQDDLTLVLLFYVEMGEFDANDHNITASNFEFISDTGHFPVIRMGNGTWQTVGSADVWHITNYSFDGQVTIIPENSTIKIYSSRYLDITFYGNYYSYNNIWLAGLGTGAFYITSGYFNNFKVDIKRTVKFTEGVYYEVNTVTMVGSAGNLITLDTDTGTGQFTLAKLSCWVSCDYLNISNSNVVGGGWYAGAHSINTTNNTGWIFTAPPQFGDLIGRANVSDYKWLSKTLKTAQQQQAVRPFYQCRIVDDSIFGDALTTPNAPLQGSACVAPDGKMFAVGLDGSNNVAIWQSDPSDLFGAPVYILENNAHNRSVYNHYAISCSDWINGTYKIDVYFFGNWDNNNSSGVLSILHYYSLNKGVYWQTTNQLVNNTTIPFSNTSHIWISAGKPYLNNSNVIISTVFYIEVNGSYFNIVHQQYLGFTNFHTAIPWSKNNVNTGDWILHSLDSVYIDGFWYIVFSGYHKNLEPVNQDTTILNYNIYVTKIDVLSNNLDGSNDSYSIWTTPEQIISSLSTSTQNKNSFTLPSLFYDGKYLWALFKGEIVTAIFNVNGTTNIETTNNYFLSKSVDFENFDYITTVIFYDTPFVDTAFYSFILQGSSYWVVGGGYLGQFVINNGVADVSDDIIDYETRDIQQNPSTLSINIGNANGKWKGENPTGNDAWAIYNNKKVALFQGYYNANGVPEVAPKNTYFIDDIQQNIQVNRNDLSLLSRDLYKQLKVLKTKFSFNYTGIKKYVDTFDGSTLNNYNSIRGRWAEGNNMLNQLTSSETNALIISNIYRQTEANTIFYVALDLSDSNLPPGTVVYYVYFYYIDDNNFMRLSVDSSGTTHYNYKIQKNVAGSLTDIVSSTFTTHLDSFGLHTFLFRRYSYKYFDIFVDGLQDGGVNIYAFSGLTNLGTKIPMGNFVQTFSLTDVAGKVAFGGSGFVSFLNFRYIEYDKSLNVIELLKNIATKAGIFDYKTPVLFEDYMFDSLFYSGTFSILNRILTIGASQIVMNTEFYIDNGELEFELRATPTIASSAFEFNIYFRDDGTNNENYYFRFYQLTTAGIVSNIIELKNTHLGNAYSMGTSTEFLNFDFTNYHKFKIILLDKYIFLSIDGIIVYSWYDNNIDSTPSSGILGFKTLTNTKLEVKSIVSNDLYSQIENFSINPGDDLENSVESLLNTVKAYFFSDLMGRLKVIKLRDTDSSNYTYEEQITVQQVDNSDKEYVNQVTVIGTNIQVTVQNSLSVNDNSIIREEVIVDYKITTYQDAVDRANLELINFNKFNTQYSPRNIMNVGSEIYDVVMVINTGPNTSEVNQTVRNYSQNMKVGGNKLNYWQTINTGQL